MIDLSYYYLILYIFIIYFLHNVEFFCLFLLGVCPVYTVFTFSLVIFDFLTSDNKERFHSFIQPRHIETCQMNFNLDRLTGWWMKGRLAKNIKTTILLHKLNFLYFWTSHFIKFESKFFLKCANCIYQRNFIEYLQEFFKRVSVFFYSIKWLDYCYMLKNWFKISTHVNTHTHTHAHTHAHTHTHN